MLVTPDQYAKPASKPGTPLNRPSPQPADAGAPAQRGPSAAAAGGNVRVARASPPAPAASPPARLKPPGSESGQQPTEASTPTAVAVRPSPAAAGAPPPTVRPRVPGSDSGQQPAAPVASTRPSPATAGAPPPAACARVPSSDSGQQPTAAAPRPSPAAAGPPPPTARPRLPGSEPGQQPSAAPMPTTRPEPRNSAAAAALGRDSPLPSPAGPPPAGANVLAADPQPDQSAGDAGGAEDEDINGQAVDILAGLTSLGISQALRDKVQDAIRALDQAAASAVSAVPELRQDGGGSGAPSPTGLGGRADGRGQRVAAAESSQLEGLERKLAMSRNIMRKLYHKNVHLEKELVLLKTNAMPVASLDLRTGRDAQGGGRPATSGGAQIRDNPVAQAIQERDSTIVQLQHALDASRRRCALLETQVPGGGGALGGGAGGGGPGSGGGSGPDARRQQQAQQQAGIREVLAQSALHLSKYQQIREDYNRLLYKRTSAVSTSKAASQQARALVDEMQMRLSNEIQEREAEAALYSARLYESEQATADWYVEKRMLEESIARLNEDASQRDRIDAEIESCICSMFERLKMLEETNARLTAKLEAAGLTGEEDKKQPS